MNVILKGKLFYSLLFILCFTLVQNVYAEPEFVFKFGSTGSDNGELDNPTDVIVDKNGKTIYVVDSKNNRISAFEDDGDYDFEYGSFCDIAAAQTCNTNADGAIQSGDGQFNNPISIALDVLGRFFVVDSDNERVQAFDDDGEFQLKFGSSDSGDNEYLGLAKGVAVQDSSRNILVSDIDQDSISVFDSTGDYLFKFDSFDSNDSFQNPSNMIIDNSREMLFVADTGNDRIIIFELVDGTTCPSGTKESVDGVCFVKKFGSSGSDQGEFDNPTGLAFDSTNDLLYVADTDNDRIQVFNIIDSNTCTGETELIDGVCFVDEFGTTGTENGNFDNPTGLAFDSTNDLLYVADTDNDRIQVFNLKTEPTVLTPSAPDNLKGEPVSLTSIIISWDEPELAENVPAISGYKIEYKSGSGEYMQITQNTKSTTTSFIHQGLDSQTTYFYRVYSINSEGTSASSSIVSVKPEQTTTPAALTATAISPSQIKLSWLPPSYTFGQKINGYEVKRVIISEVYEKIGSTNGQTTTFVVSNLATDETYTYSVSANIGYGSTPESNTASATPRENSIDTSGEPITSTAVETSVSTPPIKLTASSVSATQINLAWSPPVKDGNLLITGYKIEVKRDNNPYTTLVVDSQSTTRTYTHTNLVTNAKYTYKVSAINAMGVSEPSNEVSATPKLNVQISPIGKLTIDEGKLLSFTAKLVDSSIRDVVFSLEKNPPKGAKIISNTGMFSWMPSYSDGGNTYTFDIVVKKDGISNRQTITIEVNDIMDSQSDAEPKELGVADFVDATVSPQYYIDRYNNEPSYKKWFDDNYSKYDSIYQAVGLEEPVAEVPKVLAPFVDPEFDPQYYIDRYNNELSYKKWFDDNYSKYDSIYQAVGLEEPVAEVPKAKEKEFGICGPGTKLIDGVCTIIEKPIESIDVKPWWQFW